MTIRITKPKLNQETKNDIISIIIFIIASIIGLTLVTFGFVSFAEDEEFIAPQEIDNSSL